MCLKCGPYSLDTQSHQSLLKISSVMSSDNLARNTDTKGVNLTALCAHSYPNNLHLRKGIFLWVCFFKKTLLLFLIEIYNSN